MSYPRIEAAVACCSKSSMIPRVCSPEEMAESRPSSEGLMKKSSFPEE
jgi:hypothetical protein